MADLLKNISKKEVLNLKEEVAYQDGQIVSKTLAQNDAVSVTLFSFAKSSNSLNLSVPSGIKFLIYSSI